MGKAKNKLWTLFGRNDTNVVIAVVALSIFFSIGSSSFLSAYNLFNVSRTASLYIFMALGQAMVIVIGGLNLSLGAIGGLSVVTAGLCLDKWGMPSSVAILVTLAVGSIAGGLNGLLITRLKIHSFVITLATSFIFTGLVFGISKGFPYTNIPQSFGLFGRKGLVGIPLIFLFVIVVLCLIGYVFRYTVLGRKLLATGGNEAASRLSGIKTASMIVIANIASGFFAALTGLLFVSRMASANPATGTDWLIISFAVAVIGGTTLAGGEIKPVGLLASGFLIALIQNGLVIVGVNVYFEQMYLGFIILFAVTIESVRSQIDFMNLRKIKNTQKL